MAGLLLNRNNLFDVKPKLELKFDLEPIPFSEIHTKGIDRPIKGRVLEIFREAKKGETDLRYAAERLTGKQSFFGYKLTYSNTISSTILAHDCAIVYKEARYRNKTELCLCGTFPLDYKFQKVKPEYIIGMSVPPVMVAQIATQIWEQWLSNI